MNFRPSYLCYERVVGAAKQRVLRLVKGRGLMWTLGGATMRGSRHEELGEPNQDAFAITPAAAPLRRFAIVVADGHGDRTRHPRSEVGALLACNAAMAVWNYELENHWTTIPWDAIAVGRRMITKWVENVREDLERRPFTDKEIERVSDAGLRELLTHPVIAYGSTMITAAITDNELVVIQLGDGDALTISEDRIVSRIIPAVSHVGSLTDSLCDADAPQKVRVFQQVFSETGPPRCLILSTDGLVNSFRRSVEDEDFFKVATDLMTLRNDMGSEGVAMELPGLLAPLAAEWCADDVTIAYAFSDWNTKHGRTY